MVKNPFEKAFSMLNIKAGFAKCGIHPFNPNAIDQSKVLPSFSSSSSTDESSSTASGADNSLNTSTLSMSEIPSVNPSPIVSSHADDDGYSSPQVSSGCLTSTPVGSGSVGSQSSSQNQHNTTPHCRPQIENPLVRVGLIPQDLADIFLTPQADEREKRSSRRITGVQVLTSNEYVEMVKEKDRKEKEASEMKQRRKEERERKKMEKEKEQERKKAE